MSERTPGLLAHILDQKRRYQTVILSHDQADVVISLTKALETIASGTTDEFPPWRAIGRDQMQAIARQALYGDSAALLPVERDQLTSKINSQDGK